MALMELLTANRFDTTTMATQTSNTGTVQYLFDRNTRLSYSTVGYNSTTAATLSIVFPGPVVVSHILLQNHNLRQFSIYYNSATANTLFSTTTNSATSTYISFNSVTVSSISIDMTNSINGSVEKSIGEFVMAERRLVFTYNPSVDDWRPTMYRKQIVHEMPDGGIRAYNIRDKFRAKMSWEFIAESFRDSLRTEFDRALPMYFLPFPTTTGWDGSAQEVIWRGDFDFRHSDNAKAAGYSGSIILQETAGS